MAEAINKPADRITFMPSGGTFKYARVITFHSVVLVGRVTDQTPAARNNLKFDNKTVSRNHAQMWMEGGKLYVQDTKSTGGTFLNGVRLSEQGQESEPHEVHHNDIVAFGQDVPDRYGAVEFKRVEMKVLYNAMAGREEFHDGEEELVDYGSVNEVKMAVDTEFNTIWNSLVNGIENPLKKLRDLLAQNTDPEYSSSISSNRLNNYTTSSIGSPLSLSTAAAVAAAAVTAMNSGPSSVDISSVPGNAAASSVSFGGVRAASTNSASVSFAPNSGSPAATGYGAPGFPNQPSSQPGGGTFPAGQGSTGGLAVQKDLTTSTTGTIAPPPLEDNSVTISRSTAATPLGTVRGGNQGSSSAQQVSSNGTIPSNLQPISYTPTHGSNPNLSAQTRSKNPSAIGPLARTNSNASQQQPAAPGFIGNISTTPLLLPITTVANNNTSPAKSPYPTSPLDFYSNQGHELPSNLQNEYVRSNSSISDAYGTIVAGYRSNVEPQPLSSNLATTVATQPQSASGSSASVQSQQPKYPSTAASQAASTLSPFSPAAPSLRNGPSSSVSLGATSSPGTPLPWNGSPGNNSSTATAVPMANYPFLLNNRNNGLGNSVSSGSQPYPATTGNGNSGNPAAANSGVTAKADTLESASNLVFSTSNTLGSSNCSGNGNNFKPLQPVKKISFMDKAAAVFKHGNGADSSKLK